MKKELLRMQNIVLRYKKGNRGPFFFDFHTGEMCGIIAEDAFEKEAIADFFRCKAEMVSGEIFFRGEKILYDEWNKRIPNIIAENVSVISANSQLFEALSIVDNVFVKGNLIKSRKEKRQVLGLLEFFDVSISMHTRVKRLNSLQRLQVEILRAVAYRHKVIILADVSRILSREERKKIKQMYRQLLALGYAICQIESVKGLASEMADRIEIIGRGKTVASYFRTEINEAEIACVLNKIDDPVILKNLPVGGEEKLFTDKQAIIQMRGICHKGLKNISLKLQKGEIVQINCKTAEDYCAVKELLTAEAKAEEGEILYMGNKESRAGLYRKIIWHDIGCVDLENPENLFFSNLSIVENICYPLCLKNKCFFLKKRYRKVAGNYLKTIMPEIDLAGKIKDLTQDQIMRLALCRWLLCKPGFLLLLISGVFLRGEPDMIMDRILAEMSKYGISVLILSEHYPFESKVIGGEYYLKEGIIEKTDEPPAGRHAL